MSYFTDRGTTGTDLTTIEYVILSIVLAPIAFVYWLKR